MVLTIVAVLHVLAFACFVAATFGIQARVNLTAAGLAFWMLSLVSRSRGEGLVSLPVAYSLVLYRGDSFRRQFSVSADGQPVDLAGATVAAEIRGAPQSLPLYAFTCTIVENVITIAMSATQTAVLPANAYWDLQVTYASGEVQTFVAGGVSVRGDITGSTVGREVAHA